MLTNTHRNAVGPFLEVLGNISKIDTLVLYNCISNAQHHVCIISPIANFPSFPMSVLVYLLIVL